MASSFFKDGKFSDFTILCDGKEYHVHRCFIAPQSKYFECACAGMFKEGAECKIELKEDQAAMVDRMVHYFYNFDYDDSDISHTAPKMRSSLRIHVQMYSLGDKYDIPGLRTLALEKFKNASSVSAGSWSVLAQATYEINKAKLPECDTSFRDLMVNAWLLTGCATEISKKHPKGFASLMSSAPWLSLGIHRHTLQLLKYSHVAKQASCEQCKTDAFFTQASVRNVRGSFLSRKLPSTSARSSFQYDEPTRRIPEVTGLERISFRIFYTSRIAVGWIVSFSGSYLHCRCKYQEQIPMRAFYTDFEDLTNPVAIPFDSCFPHCLFDIQPMRIRFTNQSWLRSSNAK